jgi:hypothetical protein
MGAYPAFVSGSREELIALCEQELPDTLILAEEQVDLVPKMVAPDSGRELFPAIALISGPETANSAIYWRGETETARQLQRIFERRSLFVS